MPQESILVHAGHMITAHDQPPVIGGGVVVAGNRIQEVGTADELFRRNPEIPQVGGDSYLLLPGLINGHGHGKGVTDFQRGSLDDTLESWILGNRKFLPLPVYEDVALCAAKLLRSGVTATMHNHNLQNPADCRQEFEEAIRAYGDAGIRVQFNPGIRNQNPFIYGDNEKLLESMGLLSLQYIADILCLVTGREAPFGMDPEDAE